MPAPKFGRGRQRVSTGKVGAFLTGGFSPDIYDPIRANEPRQQTPVKTPPPTKAQQRAAKQKATIKAHLQAIPKQGMVIGGKKYSAQQIRQGLKKPR